MGERRIVILKRSIRGDGGAYDNDSKPGERYPIFVEFQVIDDPEVSCVAKRAFRLRDIEIAGAGEREWHVTHRFERDAHQYPQPPTVWLDQRMNSNVVGNFV